MSSPSASEMRSVLARIAPFVHRTPVHTCDTFDVIAGRRLYFKCENLQKTGSFKARGACNAVLKAKEELGSDLCGVVTHSSGNHGQAVAYACSAAKVPCTVVVPSDTPKVKARTWSPPNFSRCTKCFLFSAMPLEVTVLNSSFARCRRQRGKRPARKLLIKTQANFIRRSTCMLLVFLVIANTTYRYENRPPV